MSKMPLSKKILLIATGVGLYLVILAATLLLTRADERQIVSLEDTLWQIELDDEIHEEVSYNAYIRRNHVLQKNEEIICRTVLPDMGSPDFPTIFMRTRKSAVQVYLDGDLMYEENIERYARGRFVGRQVHFLSLPDDYAGKELEVHFLVGRGGVSLGYEAPVFGEYRSCFFYYVHRALPALAGGVFLLVYGFVFLFIALFFSLTMSGLYEQILGSLICADFGIWLLCYFDLTRVFVDDHYATTVEYVAFYMMIPLFYMLLGGMYQRVAPLQKIGAAGVPVVILAAILHNAGIIFIDRYALPYQMLALASFVITVAMMFYVHRRQRRADFGVQEGGLLILTVSMLIYLLIYGIQNVLGLTQDMVTMYLPVIGTTSFVTAQILNYYLHVSAAYARRREFSTLTHLAYVDVLTGLPNRKAAMNIFANMDNTHGEYCILSLDLNELKSTNDRLGHQAGDRLLQKTAEILNECFSDGFRARLSGDEFVVVMRHVTEDVILDKIRQMRKRFAAMQKKDSDVRYSISCGYAFRSEEEHESAEEVYRLADERMYEEKRQYYAGEVDFMGDL